MLRIRLYRMRPLLITIVLCFTALNTWMFYVSKQQTQFMRKSPIVIDMETLLALKAICESNGGLIRIELPKYQEQKKQVEITGVCGNNLKTFITISAVL